jgi:DNA-binding XRE family transcriptional regulator
MINSVIKCKFAVGYDGDTPRGTYLNYSTLGINIQDGSVVDLAHLSSLARQFRERSGDTQEQAAERIGKSQEQVSRAERGVKSPVATCILLIEAYSDFTVEHPLYRLRSKNHGADE